MSFFDFAVTYFTSQPTIVAVGLFFSSLALLFVLFKLEKYRPQRRLQILFASFAVVISAWSFVASSLLLCRAFIGLYQAGGDLVAVRTVFSLAILFSVIVALPVSALVTLKVPGAITKRLVDDLGEPEGAIVDMARKMANHFGISILRILQSPSGIPFAYSVGGAEGVIVISEGLVTHLDNDEIETVLAHELAHVKNHDTRLNTIVAVYRKIMFFDPFIRLLEWAIHSEKEFSADELSARETKKPLSLASALLKISSAQSGGKGLEIKTEGLSILGSSKILRTPGVKERIDRLIRLATELEESSKTLLHSSAPNVS
jgi:Zn-dependent protease with chaperone function